MYSPIPPRVWSRVQSQCTYTIPTTNSNTNSVYVPLIKKTVSQAQADYGEKVLYKGNILQYKANSAQFTKNQQYSQLAKGGGPNRTSVFATQSITYTNPNTTGLQRVGSVQYPFPNQLVGKPNNISGPYQYNVPNPNNCPGTAIQDGGTLICGTYTNPCTGNVIKPAPKEPTCFPTTCSDVPGKPVLLCWNPRLQTWYPRQRYFMNNSTDKWPEGYKGFVSAVQPTAPNLSYTSNNANITLFWNNIPYSNSCIPTTGYNVYQNNLIIASLAYNTSSYSIPTAMLTPGIQYTYYITAVSSSLSSPPSNAVTITATNVTATSVTATI
jgi:hypothetical protein